MEKFFFGSESRTAIAQIDIALRAMIRTLYAYPLPTAQLYNPYRTHLRSLAEHKITKKNGSAEAAEFYSVEEARHGRYNAPTHNLRHGDIIKAWNKC